MRYFLVCILIVLSGIRLKMVAQPSPCGPMPAMTSTCQTSCIICDIDGFTGINDSNITGQAPPGFCTTQVHHMQWIAFIAGTTNLTIELEVFNCRSNNGLEVGIYEAIDCNNYRQVTDCDTDIRPNTKRIFKNTVPLTIGQYYFWVMDGSANDVCNYTIRVLEGSTKVAPLDVAPVIAVPAILCQGKELQFSTPGLVGATIYEWFIDGNYAGRGTTLPAEFSVAGKHTICLDAFNVCDRAPQQCIEVDVLPAKEGEIRQEICFGECFRYQGKDYCDAGVYPVLLKAENGCDSTVYLDLAIKDQVSVSQFARICEGDTLTLGEDGFTAAGQHTGFVTDEEGCKVKVNLTLEVIKCNIRAGIQIIPVSCTGKKDGMLNFAVTNGTPPFTYAWKRLENESETGQGAIDAENSTVNLSGLDEGTYLIEIRDTFGNFAVVQAYVTQPPRLIADIADTMTNGYHVLCHGDKTASLNVSAAGGTGAYQIKWSVGSADASISGLGAGNYIVTLTDANGCTTTAEQTVTQPPALDLNLSIQKPDCSAILSGILDIASVSGGIQPYSYKVNGQTASFPLKGLGSGTYLVELTDANGCTFSVTDTFRSLEIPALTGINIYEVLLGDSVLINVQSSVTPDAVIWKPPTGIQRPDQLNTYARPIASGNYEVTVISSDGCSATYQLSINVQKRRSFVICNAITQREGNNGTLRYFAGPDVSAVLHYSIYDRWGSLVYDVKNLPPGIVDLPWDKTFNGRRVAGGVYVWTATVSYIDGEQLTYTGSLNVVD